VRATHPFDIVAWVLLPDHLHAIWQLPGADARTGLRWSLIKAHVTRASHAWLPEQSGNRSREKRGEGALWQRRFWEHLIVDERDLERHIDYIHFNPVKHGYAKAVSEWPYSTFHRYVREGVYPLDWAGIASPSEPTARYGE
jgi:putative transposase